MNKDNILKYLEEDIKYFEPKIIITILEDILGKRFESIKKDVNESKICVNRQQIEGYLNKLFEENDPELKRRIEERKNKKQDKNILSWTKIDIEDSVQAFSDQLEAKKYYFEPYTLKYFNKYSNIVRNKALKILNIIEGLVNQECYFNPDLLEKLDIKLDENGNIKREDIIRLVKPFVYNYNALVEKVSEANNLDTYLTFKQSLHSVYRSGFSEDELYPTTSIQVNNCLIGDLPGNIPLSDYQKQILNEKFRKSSRKLVKSLLK